MSNIYYLNSLFDLELGGFATDNLARAAAEMTALFVPVGTTGDRVLIDTRVPEEYFNYLSSLGLECPRAIQADEQCQGCDPVVWGHNEQSVARLGKLGVESHHPDLEVIRKVNSRLFGHKLCTELGLGVPDSLALATFDSVETALASWNRFPLVIKPAFGNAGYGFMTKESAELSDHEHARLVETLNTCGGVTLEPWLERVTDISTRFELLPDGVVEGLSHHQCHANAAGTFFADLLDPADETVTKWREQLDNAAGGVAQALHNEGYFGPVGLDSFVWRDSDGTERLAPVIEINARHAVSTIAYALRKRLAPERVCYFRFVGRRRHELPETYRELKKLLGTNTFRRSTKRGIALATPLRVSHNSHWQQPSRSAFFIAAPSAEEVLKIDSRLRESFSGAAN